MAKRPVPDRSARARHRPAARRPLAGGRRHRRVVARGRRGVHARRVRQGLLRRPDRGSPGSLCADHGYRVPGAHSTQPTNVEHVASARLPGVPTRSPARLVVALSVAGVLAVFLLYTAVAGNSTPTLTPSQLAARTAARSPSSARSSGRSRGDSHSARGLRFGSAEHRRAGAGSSRSSTAATARRRSSASAATSSSAAATRRPRRRRTDILTKCPSKYRPRSPRA